MTAFTTLALVSGALLAGSVTAQAESACGASYLIQPGDTLYDVSQRCEVSLSRIMDLNPSIDPRDLRVGMRVRLEARAGYDEPEREARRYTLQRGDTLYSVARQFGYSLLELLNLNETIDPDRLRPGEVIVLPGDAPLGTVRVSPDSGPSGSLVTVTAYNLRPRDWVTIGAGPRSSQWRRITESQVSGSGRLDVNIRVPAWADPGDRLVFVVDTDRGLTLKSDPFEVTGERRGDAGPEPVREYEGRIVAGAQCHLLEARDGNTYALISDDVSLTPGEYVRLEGVRTQSTCQAGAYTIDVGLVREITPPRQRDWDARVSYRGRIRTGAECPVIETESGETFALVSHNARFEEGAYVEIEGRHTALSNCMEGEGTVQVLSLRQAEPPRGGEPDFRATGWIDQGTECPLLRTSEGRVYALTGGNAGDYIGEWVEVTGRRADMSFCMEGEATIAVDAIRD